MCRHNYVVLVRNKLFNCQVMQTDVMATARRVVSILLSRSRVHNSNARMDETVIRVVISDDYNCNMFPVADQRDLLFTDTHGAS